VGLRGKRGYECSGNVDSPEPSYGSGVSDSNLGCWGGEIGRPGLATVARPAEVLWVTRTCVGGAVFDPDGIYRYLLWRCWDSGAPRVVFVMLNPSTADASRNDPTIRRCIGFAQTWGFGSVGVVNLFAYRSTDWHELSRAANPVGPDNDFYLNQAVHGTNLVMAAWGNHGALAQQSSRVLSRIDRPIHCLGFTRTGQPRHPLCVDGRVQPVPMSREAGSGEPGGVPDLPRRSRGTCQCAS
jgi:hypothetical protein